MLHISKIFLVQCPLNLQPDRPHTPDIHVLWRCDAHTDFVRIAPSSTHATEHGSSSQIFY